MAQQFDILIRNARLRNDKDQLFDIGIENSKITAIAEHLSQASNQRLMQEGIW